jgi:hypothetical protein
LFCQFAAIASISHIASEFISFGCGFALREELAEADKQVNAWLVESKVQVRRTSTAFKRFRDMGKDAITGRTVARHGVGVQA